MEHEKDWLEEARKFYIKKQNWIIDIAHHEDESLRILKRLYEKAVEQKDNKIKELENRLENVKVLAGKRIEEIKNEMRDYKEDMGK